MDSFHNGKDKEVHAISRKLAGTGIGVKKRQFGTIKYVPSMDELHELATRAAAAGGLEAVEVNWEEELLKWMDPVNEMAEPSLLLRDYNIKAISTEDTQRTLRRLVRATKRNTFPEWSLPGELWIMALDPGYVSMCKKSIEGVGYETLEQVPCEAPRNAITECIAHCHRAQVVPLEANSTLGFFVDKKTARMD